MGRSGGSGGRGGGGSFGGSRGGGGRIGGSFGGGRSGRSGGSLFGGGSGRSGGGLFGGGGSGRSGGGLFGGGSHNHGHHHLGSGLSGLFGTRRTVIMPPVIVTQNNPRPASGGTPPVAPPPSGSTPPTPSGGSTPPARKQSGLGCGTVLLIAAIVTVILVAMAYALSSGGIGSVDPDITRSTVARVPLPPGSVNETAYYTDMLDWIGNRTTLQSGLKHFYQKTGVQPHLYITDTVNGSHYPSQAELEQFANGLYDQLFTDEAHLLLVFFEYDGKYMDWYVTGTQAKTVIDTEAGDILLDYLDRYYYYKNLTDEEYFSLAFRDAADRIMTVTRSPWIPVMLVLGVVLLAAIMLVWWQSAKHQKNLEARRTEEILKAPLEKFGDTEAEDLAKKYRDGKAKPTEPKAAEPEAIDLVPKAVEPGPPEPKPVPPGTADRPQANGNAPKDPGPHDPKLV